MILTFLTDVKEVTFYLKKNNNILCKIYRNIEDKKAIIIWFRQKRYI